MSDRRIVSSRHLADGEGWEASEYEFGLIIAYNAFSRWMVKCMASVGEAEMSPLEILVLHNINHRGREKKLGDICFLLNFEDSYTVSYAIRKLSKANLVTSTKRGKEVFYRTSQKGQDLCDAYREVRKQCLLEGLTRIELSGEELRSIGADLRALSGYYDQASRAASSL